MKDNNKFYLTNIRIYSPSQNTADLGDPGQNVAKPDLTLHKTSELKPIKRACIALKKIQMDLTQNLLIRKEDLALFPLCKYRESNCYPILIDTKESQTKPSGTQDVKTGGMSEDMEIYWPLKSDEPDTKDILKREQKKPKVQ